MSYVYIGTFYVEVASSVDEEETFDKVQSIVDQHYAIGGWVSDGGDSIEMDTKQNVRKEGAVESLKKILKAAKGAVVYGEVGVCNAEDPSDYTLLSVKNNVLTVKNAKFEAKKAKVAKKKAKASAKKAPAKGKVAKKAKTKVVTGLAAKIKKEQRMFMENVDQWFGNMAPGKDIPFKISDPDHGGLRDIRKEIVAAGGKTKPAKDLPKLAKKAWVDVISKMDREMFDELGYDRYYELAAERFFGK